MYAGFHEGYHLVFGAIQPQKTALDLVHRTKLGHAQVHRPRPHIGLRYNAVVISICPVSIRCTGQRSAARRSCAR